MTKATGVQGTAGVGGDAAFGAGTPESASRKLATRR